MSFAARHRKNFVQYAAAALVLAVIGVSALGTVPFVRAALPPANIVAYQGRILNANGVPVSDASLDMQFALYADSGGVTCLWSNDDGACGSTADMTITLTDGLFSVNLGDASEGFDPISTSVFADDPSVFLQVKIEGETLLPLKRVVAAPYAINSQTLDGLDSTDFCQTAGAGCLWQEGLNGTFEDDAAVIVGPDVASTLSNGGFSLSGGNDLFVGDSLGVEGTIYSDSGLIVGASTTYANDSITTSGAEDLTLTIGGGDLFIGTTSIVGTTGDLDFTNFDMDGATGDVTTAGSVTTAGDVNVNGGNVTSTISLNVTPTGTLTLNPSGQIILDGGSTIDASDNILSTVGAVTIEDDLFPEANNTRNLGSALLGWAALFVRNTDDSTTVSLSADGSDETNSGASVIGVNDEFDNSTGGNVQDTLDDLDGAIAIGGAGAMWTLAGGVIYPTSAANDLAVGGTTAAASAFGVDESSDTVFVGDGTSANGKITFKSTDPDSGTIEYTTDDLWFFGGGDVFIGASSLGSVNAGFVPNGNDLYVDGDIAAQTNMYANEFVAGDASTHYKNGEIENTSGDLNLLLSGGDLTFGQATTIGDNGDTLTIDSDGTVFIDDATLAGTGTFTVNSGAASTLTINSGTTGSIAIGDDASSETIGLGTGGAVKTVTVGSTNTTSATTLQSGTGDVSITSTDDMQLTTSDQFGIDGDEFDLDAGTASITIDDAGNLGSILVEGTLLDMDELSFGGVGSIKSGGSDDLTINSGLTGTLNIATDASSESVNVGTGAAVKTLILGSTTTTSMTTIQSGTGDLVISSTDDIVFDDLQIAGTIQLSDTDGSFTSGDIGIIDAINTSYTAATVWTDGATITYLTDSAEDISVGAGNTLVAPFSVDVSANLLRIGDGASDTEDPTIDWFASDATDSGSLSFTDDDRWFFDGGDVFVGASSVSAIKTAPGFGDSAGNHIFATGDIGAQDDMFADTFVAGDASTTFGNGSITDTDSAADDLFDFDLNGTAESLRILDGNLRVGSAAPSITLDGSDFLVTGDSEFGSTARFNSDVDVRLNNAENVVIGSDAGTGSNTVDFLAVNIINTDAAANTQRGLVVTNQAASTSATESLLTINNEDAIAVTDGIVITSSGAGGITTALNFADSDIGTDIKFQESATLSNDTDGNLAFIENSRTLVLDFDVLVGSGIKYGSSEDLEFESGASSTNAIVLDATAAGSGIDMSAGTDGFDMTVSGAAANAITVDATAVTTGKGINLDTNGLTTGKGFSVRVGSSLTEAVALGAGMYIDYETGGGGSGTATQNLFAIETDTDTDDKVRFRVEADGEAFSDTGFTVGSTTTYADNSITSSGTLTIDSGGTTTFATNDDVTMSGDMDMTIAGTENFTITSGAAPTADMMVLTSDVFASASDGIDALQISFDTLNADGNFINITPGGADAELNANGGEDNFIVDVDNFTYNASAGGNNVRAVNIGTLTETTALNVDSAAVSIGTGWDKQINGSGFSVAGGGATTITPTTDVTALTLTGSSATTAKMLALDTRNTTGTIASLSFGAATVQTGNISGFVLDMSTNLTLADGTNVSSYSTTTPGGTHSGGGSETYTGYDVKDGATITQNTAAGSVTWKGFNATLPALVATTGTVTANGMLIAFPTTTPVSGAGTGTSTGVNIVAPTVSGASTGKLTGVNISTLGGPGGGIENAIVIGDGWDDAININLGNLVIETNGNISSTAAPLTIDAAGNVDINDELTIDLDGGAVTTAALCGNQGVGDIADTANIKISDCSGAPVADYAEQYPVEAGVTYGDIVVPGTTTVTTIDGDTIVQLVKSSTPYQGPVAGIVSDNYDDFTSAGYNIDAADNPMPVALAGRVLVNVTDENGPISIGDYITTSSTAGYGMKADDFGRVIGMALADFSDPSGQVMVQVMNTWYQPDVLSTDGSSTVVSSDVDLDATGTADATTTGYDSQIFSLRGSGWDGAAAQEVKMSLGTEVTDATDYRLSVKDTSGTEVAYVNQDGDLAISGRLYPSDRGTLQTSKYIYYDSTDDYMRTNAAGWSTGSYDFAEKFPSADALEPGELVVFGSDNESVARATVAQDPHLVGIVSTRPGFLAGENLAHTYPIALAGRVPTKVNLENGSIAIGDALTSSSTAGYAMKATEPGAIVGFAMEPYDGSGDEKIIVFVNAEYWNGEAGSLLAGTDNRASQIVVSQNANNLTVLNMNGNIYMTGNDILGIRRIAGLSDRWSIEEDGTVKTEATLKTVITTYQNERVETAAVTSPDVMINLVGTAELDNGQAVISFEDVSANFNDITSTVAPIRVVVTPNGPVSLYVTDKSNNGFTVHQLGGNDSGVSFDWMVTAYRKDYEPADTLTVDVPAEETPVEVTPVEVTPEEVAPEEVPVSAEGGSASGGESAPVEEAPVEVVPVEVPTTTDVPVVTEPTTDPAPELPATSPEPPTIDPAPVTE